MTIGYTLTSLVFKQSEATAQVRVNYFERGTATPVRTQLH
jgi:hypothetical protein